MYLLYDIVSHVVHALLVAWYLLKRLITGSGRRGIGERLGFVALEKVPAGRGGIWVHAVSVGETMAARALVAALRERYPGRPLIFSTVTETGREISENIPGIDCRIYFPFDISCAVRRVFQRLRPELVVIVETEIWPNFLRQAQAQRVPVVLANGRISDRSFPRYLRARRYLRPALSCFTRLCMQTPTDAERVVTMGAPAERVAVVRNLKYDVEAREVTAAERGEARKRFGLPQELPLFVAASTHPGEEETVLAAFRALRERGPCLLALVPRHPVRGDEVTAVAENAGFRVVRRSSAEGAVDGNDDLLLVDTVGELMELYRGADAVFVGGSFVPIGGHNVLEPASLAKPVLFGPHMSNFREAAALVLAAGGGREVAGADSLAAEAAALLADPAAAAAMGARGLAVLRENSGAVDNHLRIIAAVLGQ